MGKFCVGAIPRGCNTTRTNEMLTESKIKKQEYFKDEQYNHNRFLKIYKPESIYISDFS